MPDGDVGPLDADSGVAERRQDLFVDAVGPTDFGAERKESHVIDDGGAGPIGFRVALTADHVGRGGRFERIEERFELRLFGLLDSVVGVEPEGIVAGGASEGGVPGSCEILNPDEIEDARAERFGDLGRAVGAAGVDNNNLFEEARDRAQTRREVLGLVADDHGQGGIHRR